MTTALRSPLDDLRQRAEAGEADAQLTLGRRLLTGDGGPASPIDGAAWIDRSAASGEVDALLLAATIAAAGLGRPQDCARALELLRRAAAAGSADAAGQLAVLGADPAFWRERAARESLCEAPRIRIVRGFLPPAACDWLMARAGPGLARATMYNPTTGRDEPHPGRTNSAVLFDVMRAGAVIGFLRERIAATVGVPAACFEPTQVFHYAEGQQIAPHFDYIDNRSRLVDYATGADYQGQRVATFLIYLNDDFEGGATVFPKVDVSFTGRKGDAIFFANVDPAGQPEKLSLHTGTPPTAGEKWIVSQWIHDRPFTASL